MCLSIIRKFANWADYFKITSPSTRNEPTVILSSLILTTAHLAFVPPVLFVHRRHRTKDFVPPSGHLINHKAHRYWRKRQADHWFSNGTSQTLPVPEFTETSKWRSPAKGHLGSSLTRLQSSAMAPVPSKARCASALLLSPGSRSLGLCSSSRERWSPFWDPRHLLQFCPVHPGLARWRWLPPSPRHCKLAIVFAPHTFLFQS